MRRPACIALLLACGGCLGLFEAFDPEGKCAPFESKSLDLDAPNRAGFSGADLLASLEAAQAARIEWADGSSQLVSLSFDTEAGAKVTLVSSADSARECDSEVSEVELRTSLVIDAVGGSQRLPGTARPLLSAGELLWVSFDADRESWQLGGSYGGEDLRVKLRTPAPPAVAGGDEIGSIYRAVGSCVPSGETGSACDDELVGTLFATNAGN